MTGPGVDEKVCPDCAETLKPAARVCRYCRYEFWPSEAPAAPTADGSIAPTVPPPPPFVPTADPHGPLKQLPDRLTKKHRKLAVRPLASATALLGSDETVVVAVFGFLGKFVTGAFCVLLATDTRVIVGLDNRQTPQAEMPLADVVVEAHSDTELTLRVDGGSWKLTMLTPWDSRGHLIAYLTDRIRPPEVGTDLAVRHPVLAELLMSLHGVDRSNGDRIVTTYDTQVREPVLHAVFGEVKTQHGDGTTILSAGEKQFYRTLLLDRGEAVEEFSYRDVAAASFQSRNSELSLKFRMGRPATIQAVRPTSGASALVNYINVRARA